jgi:hypothetical protein
MDNVITAIRRGVVHRGLAGSVPLEEGAVAGWEEHPRTSPRFTRWTVLLALAIASVAATVMAQEKDTLTISSMFYMDWLSGTVGPDLAEVYTNGYEHTWTLTLHGTTKSHDKFIGPFGVTNYTTEIHAPSFELEFSGPDAATLNEIVSNHIAGGDISIYLRNAYSSGFGDDFAVVYVWPMGPDVEFFAGHDLGSFTLLPTNADGYPDVGPEPFSIWSEYSLWIDRRAGNNGSIESRESLLTFEVTPSLPRLSITRSNNAVIVSWPSPSTGFSLQQNNQLTTTHWITPTETVTDTGTIKFITVDSSVGSRFYRLSKP